MLLFSSLGGLSFAKDNVGDKNKAHQEEICFADSKLSDDEFLFQANDILQQSKSLTLCEYNHELANINDFPENIKDFLLHKQKGLSSEAFVSQLSQLLESEFSYQEFVILTNEQMLRLFKISLARINVTMNKNRDNLAKYSFPMFGGFYTHFTNTLQQKIEEDDGIKVLQLFLQELIMDTIRDGRKEIIKMNEAIDAAVLRDPNMTSIYMANYAQISILRSYLNRDAMILSLLLLTAPQDDYESLSKVLSKFIESEHVKQVTENALNNIVSLARIAAEIQSIHVNRPRSSWHMSLSLLGQKIKFGKSHTVPNINTTKSEDQTTKSKDQTTKSKDQTTKSKDQTTKSEDQTTKSKDQKLI
jgi:hypothetical protein